MLDATANTEQSRPASGIEKPAKSGVPTAAPSVTRRLVTLLVVVTIPLLAFSVLLILRNAQQQQRESEQQIRATTVATVLAVDGEILRQQAIVATMRNVRSIHTHEWEAFYQIAKASIASEPNALITLYDPTGQEIVATEVPYGTPLPRTVNPGPIRRVIDSGKPYVSDLLFGTVSREQLIATYVPVFQEGSVAYILSIAFPPDAISSILHQQAMPNSGFGVVIDRTGTIIARTLGESDFVGKRSMPGFVELALKFTEGRYRTRTLEGLYIDADFVRSSLSGWTVSLGMQQAALDAPLWRSLWMFGGGGLAIFAATMALGWYQGRGVVLMLARLTRMAEALGRGESLAPTTLGIREAQYIADGMVAASKSLDRHTAERDAIMATLNASNQRLELANKDLESFSYSVSHDLRTPLRAIDGFSRILAEDYAASLDQEGLRLLNLVSDNARKLSRLIDDILAFSRTGRQEIELTDVDMTALAHEVIDGLKPALDRRTVTIDIAPLPMARTDRAMMQRVLTNLLDNALKYTAARPAATIAVTGHISGDEAIYRIKDNGVGFDEKYVGKLFGVFQRLHAPSDFQGTGIGLAIVKRIITRQGGRVWAEGTLGEGAAFYFTIPQITPTAPHSNEA
jgi:signal transduction histidine kinase